MSDNAVTPNRIDTNRVFSGIMPPYWDKLDINYASATNEIYTFSTKNPDSPDTYLVEAIISVDYLDKSKCAVTSVTKTFQNRSS